MISAGVEPCRRSHLPMDILLPLFGHTTIECINGQKMVLTKLRPLYPSIVGGDDCLFIKSAHRSHQRCHNGGNSPPIIIGTYHRMYHRPNKVYLWSFVRYLPSSFPLFDRRRTMIVWHLHRRSPPTADRRLRWVYNRKDAGMLIVLLHLTLTPTSLNLYTARQGYNHRRSISR